MTARAAPSSAVRRAIDWGELSPLGLRAREVAEGLYAGPHRSVLRGAGVEFGGYREYVPGDDLRWLDRRSLLRHERLVVRQFETETDRALCLVVDATASMAYRSAGAPGSKLAFAAVFACALAYVALKQGDPVGLTFAGGSGVVPVGRATGREQFERIVAALERTTAEGDAVRDPSVFDRALATALRGTRRGAVAVVIGDLLDASERDVDRVASVAAGGRVLGVVQTLDPAEVAFPFEGSVRLRAFEGDAAVETDGETARDRYRAALDGLTRRWRDAVVRRGGRFLRVTTDESIGAGVRAFLEALR